MFVSFFATVQLFFKRLSKAVKLYSDLTVPGRTWKDSSAQKGKRGM